MVFKKVVILMMGCLGLSRQPTQAAETSESSMVVVDEHDYDDSRKIRLGDGRLLAYSERGVPKNESRHRVIMVHGFASSKDMKFMASQELLNEMRIYLLLFDRAGYGESDPNPKRSLNSEASDIEELADKLQLGAKFYVIGVSLGCYPVWSCLKRIPNRLAGTALVVPCINYTWRSLPSDLTRCDYRKVLSKWTHFLARHTPGLLHWLVTQKWVRSSAVLDRNSAFFSQKDVKVLKESPGYQFLRQGHVRMRDVFESVLGDFIVGYGKWEFEPLDLSDPYPQKDSMVHIWQGCEDKVIPCHLQRYVAERLPWIRYHEVPDGGHMLVYDHVVCESILRSLLLGEDSPLYRHGLSEPSAVL